jgi:glycosyltransferase involved in cell wall biosynthesis
MRVLVAAASYSASISGVQRHALNMTQCLMQLPEVSELHFVVAPWQADFAECAGLPVDPRMRTHIAGIGRNSLDRNRWYYEQLPRLAREISADIVHFSYPMPLNAQAFNCPTVVTLHDLYPFEIPMNFGFPKFVFNRAVLRQCLRAADAIACVSEATVLRLKQYLDPAVCRKAIRIYNCVGEAPQAASRSPIPMWKGEPFLLCVAQHRRNKNIPALIRAFERLLASDWIDANARLVVIGTRGPETKSICSLIDEKNLRERASFLEGLTEPQLQWCYQHCEVLAAPSLTEGFGLSIAEGLLAGCRIVCSDIPAHREVGGDRCRFVTVHANAVEGLAAVIADAWKEPKPTPVELPAFSASVLARQYLALYGKLLGWVAENPAMHSVSGKNASEADANAFAAAVQDPVLAIRGR